MSDVLGICNRTIKNCLVVSFTLANLISCSSNPSTQSHNKLPTLKNESKVMISELPFPVPPDSLTVPEERAAFVSRHFWDSMDFGNDALALDTAFMEQNFANFLSVLSVTPHDAAKEAVARLDSMALTSPRAFELLQWVTEKYLDDPNSPMRDEELYMLFLDDLSQSAKADEATRERAKHRLAVARKNRRGTPAADFRFVDRDGSATTLRKSLGDAATLLMFYDPDCPQCKEAKEALEKVPAAEGLKIVAIDIAGNRQLWDSTKASMPAEWTVGFATDPLEEEETYDFPAMPVFYLLDSEGTVLLKDPPLPLLLSSLSSLSGPSQAP